MDERAKKLLVKRARRAFKALRRAKGQYVVFQVMRIESEFMAYYAGVMEMADWEGDLWDWGKRVRDCVMQAASVAIQQAARASQESERAVTGFARIACRGPWRTWTSRRGIMSDKTLDQWTDVVLWLAIITVAGQICRGFLGW